MLFSLATLCSLTAVALGTLVPKSVPKGFVTTQGRNFVLDGEPFAWVGANSYWLPLLLTDDDVDLTFQTMQNAGVKVLRTWGFNAINGSELAGALESGLTYYQLWNSSEWILNDGPQGLQRLDNVIETAGKHGIKVILAFTNNWVGYGGMELYLNWIAGAGVTHDVFYTDPDVVASYQRYVKTIVERYKNSPNIFAWELMNEARCLGDLPSSASCSGQAGTITNWYKEQSDFVRSLDPFHLITTGGEGHFTWKHPETYWFNGTLVDDYNYDGQAGENFNAELKLENIDFVTYHLYPQLWYPEFDFPGTNFSLENWGLQWISQHAAAAASAQKPVILEEFGVVGAHNKTVMYPSWVDRAIETGHSGIMPWQFGVLGLTEDGGNRLIKYADEILNGASPNDGDAFYINQTSIWDIFTNAAKVQAKRSWIV